MNRSLRAALAVAVLVLLGAASLALAGSATAKSSIHPHVGHYEGRDAHHGHIRFYYNSHHHITHFRVDHTLFPNAFVDGIRWHHTCSHGLCTRAHWVANNRVEGHWNNSNTGGDVAFHAHHVG